MSKLLAKAHIWAMNKRHELEQARENEEGQTLIEYTLIIGVVVVFLWGAMMLSGLDEKVTGAIADLMTTFDGIPGGE